MKMTINKFMANDSTFLSVNTYLNSFQLIFLVSRWSGLFAFSEIEFLDMNSVVFG